VTATSSTRATPTTPPQRHRHATAAHRDAGWAVAGSLERASGTCLSSPRSWHAVARAPMEYNFDRHDAGAHPQRRDEIATVCHSYGGVGARSAKGWHVNTDGAN